jgi:hypothetical protein
MNKKLPYIFILLAIIIQLFSWISVYIFTKFSFFPESAISEESAILLIRWFLAVGGFCGIVLSAIGIYLIVLRKKVWFIIPEIILLFLPVLIVSTVNFFAVLMLSAML